jgi:hypothetical protein
LGDEREELASNFEEAWRSRDAKDPTTSFHNVFELLWLHQFIYGCYFESIRNVLRFAAPTVSNITNFALERSL